MSRLLRSDFVELCSFIRSYSIAEHLDDPHFVSLASKCHKRYFALMAVGAEISVQHKGSNSKKASAEKRGIYLRNQYLQEVVSDIGSAFFSWHHGAYKGSNLLIRSGIENLLKVLSMEETPSILTTKSVYQVFDIAKETEAFSQPLQLKAFFLLSTIYSELCADVHGATPEDLQKIESLSHFPNFEAAQAERTAELLCKVAVESTSLLCLTFPEILAKMHHLNADAVKEVLSKPVKRTLHSI
jgi:hypothetical protein